MEDILEESLNDLIKEGNMVSANRVLESVKSTFSKYDLYRAKIDDIMKIANGYAKKGKTHVI